MKTPMLTFCVFLSSLFNKIGIMLNICCSIHVLCFASHHKHLPEGQKGVFRKRATRGWDLRVLLSFVILQELSLPEPQFLHLCRETYWVVLRLHQSQQQGSYLQQQPCCSGFSPREEPGNVCGGVGIGLALLPGM